ncbi:glutaredoxin-like protein [Exiguobacterium phage vB_EalM-132]|nr:glutaredoxin-like protein [Exiguobacterium phage vB_EalM-132]
MPKITVFTADNCTPCKMVKQLLNTHGITFDEKSITEENNMTELTSLGFMKAPVTIIDENAPILGADFRLIHEQLGL